MHVTESMFTGLVEELGVIREVNEKPGSIDLLINCQQVIEGLAIGDSIAINGTCLTVTGFDETSFTVTAAPETLSKTNLGLLKTDVKVNLERSVTLQTRLGGHLVQGHVDGTAIAALLEIDGDSHRWTFRAKPELLLYMVMKGSVTVNGVSLTIASLDDNQFSVVLIPKTISSTTFQYMEQGDKVNIETDLIGKYVHRFMHISRSTPE